MIAGLVSASMRSPFFHPWRITIGASVKGCAASCPAPAVDVLYASPSMVTGPQRVAPLRRLGSACALVATLGCAAAGTTPTSASGVVAAGGAPAAPPRVVRVDPLSGGGAPVPAGLE